MASEKLFEDIPPFPDDVPTASLTAIPLEGLTSGDEATAKQMLQACQELGFFLLDLHGSDLGETLIQEIDQVYIASKEILNLPEEEKQKFEHDPPKSFLGFKPKGCTNTETGQPDRFGWFNLGQDGLLGTIPQAVPSAIETRRDVFVSFLKHGQEIVSMISESIARSLSLPPSTFSELAPLHKPSGTAIRLIKMAASPTAEDLRTSMIPHTDFGTVTLLVNVLGGLQILAPGKSPKDEDAWTYVKPRPGCLIVNMGDAMVQWTGGLLKSNMHRVIWSPGEQRYVERYSVGLLVRPERDAPMKRFLKNGKDGLDEDEGLTAFQWEAKKFMKLKRDDYVLPKDVRAGAVSAKG